MSKLKSQSVVTEQAYRRASERILPNDWRWVRLGEVITEAQPGFACGARDPNGVIQLRMNNVDTRGNLVWDEFIRVPADKETVSKYQLVKGDIVFNNTNSTELVGKSAIYSGHTEPIVYSNHFTRLRVDHDKLEPAYLAPWLLLQWESRTFENLCNRWIGQSAVKNDKLLSLEIPLPPLSEQRRIAAILNEQMAVVERARAAATARLEAAKALPAAYLREVFNGPEAEKWPRKPIRDFAETCSGSTPSRGRNDYYVGTIRWVKTGELRDGLIDNTEEHISEETLHETSLRLLPAETLLVGMYGQGQTRGRTGLLLKPAATNQACFAILPNPKEFDSRFLQLWFRHNYSRLRRETEGRGGSQPNLNGDVLRSQLVSLPPVYEQQRIVALLSEQMAAVERARVALEEELEAINKLPARLLRRVFSGEL